MKPIFRQPVVVDLRTRRRFLDSNGGTDLAQHTLDTLERAGRTMAAWMAPTGGRARQELHVFVNGGNELQARKRAAKVGVFLRMHGVPEERMRLHPVVGPERDVRFKFALPEERPPDDTPEGAPPA